MPAVATERVLATLNVDGSRRWIRPRWTDGRWGRRRRVVAYLLMALFLAVPHLHVNGRPLLLLDVVHREFTVGGVTFLATDTLLLMLLLFSIFIAIFLLTALLGRVWCGWGCPQTVWLEFLFRPIERRLEGGPGGSRRLDALGWRGQLAPARLGKHAIYLAIAVVLGNTFLAYFVGTGQLAQWVRQDPHEHWVPFAIMAITTGLVMFDFAYFREQTCLVACPYGRIQSALLDRQSLLVAYDAARGEPRGHGAPGVRTGLGDCVDCGACANACPTGIDIRDGFQLECIHCTQCIDACDAIMARVGRPRGLVRYSSREALEGRPTRWLRPRTVLYPVALAAALTGLGLALRARGTAEVTLLRSAGAAPFLELADGRIENQLEVKVVNRNEAPRSYRIALDGAPGAQLIAPENPMAVAPRGRRTMTIFVLAPRALFSRADLPITLRVTDGASFAQDVPSTLLGPSGVAR